MNIKRDVILGAGACLGAGCVIAPAGNPLAAILLIFSGAALYFLGERL